MMRRAAGNERLRRLHVQDSESMVRGEPPPGVSSRTVSSSSAVAVKVRKRYARGVGDRIGFTLLQGEFVAFVVLKGS
jgi:hypothetical protein